jgi:membrane-associated phospholipid phosphatase
MRAAIVAGGVIATVLVGASGHAHADELCALNPLDCLTVDRFSATADTTSDALFVASLALPVGLELGRGFNDNSLRRGIAYGSALGATGGLALAVKYSVRRDRPYTYNRDPRVVAYAAHAHGNDHSFFSGHTSLTFAAATSSGVLNNAVSHSDRARAALWAGGGALAAATGMLRIRAGMHFPTDVLVGAAIGTGFGIGLTLAIAPDATIAWRDVGALSAGVVVGSLLTAVIPMPHDVVLPLGASDLTVAPLAPPGGGLGLSIAATLR